MKKQVKLTAKSENTCKKSLRTKSRFSSMRMILPNAVLINPCAKTSLRAKCRFLGFARKCQPPITGKTAIFRFARKIKPSVTGKTLIPGICP